MIRNNLQVNTDKTLYQTDFIAHTFVIKCRIMTIEDFNMKACWVKRDLTSSAQNKEVLNIASNLYRQNEDIIDLEHTLFSDAEYVRQANPILLEALKCASSKKKLSDIDHPVHISVVFAMYGETERLKPLTPKNPHGEDCLMEKIRQLNWLTSDLPDISWSMIAVDDGCCKKPSSAEVARELLSLENQANVTVLKLSEAIGNEIICKGFMDLEKTSDSKKGGAITYGLWKAQETFIPLNKQHVICYTDADLSSNLGQLGHLVLPISKGKKAALAQRYGMIGSALIKKEENTSEPDSTRNQPGKNIILLRHFARESLLPSLRGINDVQAGFKAFDAQALKKATLHLKSMNQTFDVELLLRFTCLHGRDSVHLSPILFTEDLDLSNFPANAANTTHLEMFSQLVEIYSNVGIDLNQIDEEIYQFWLKLDFEDLSNILENISTEMENLIDQELFNFKWSIKTLKSLMKKSNQLVE